VMRESGGGRPRVLQRPLTTFALTCARILLWRSNCARPSSVKYRRSWLIMNVAAAAGLAISIWGSAALSPEASSVLAAFTVGTVASALCLLVRARPLSYTYVRARLMWKGDISYFFPCVWSTSLHRPRTSALQIGVMMLVPGSIGVRGATTMFSHSNADAGTGASFAADSKFHPTHLSIPHTYAKDCIRTGNLCRPSSPHR
jgi:uncharacterized membrane protein YjjB (DUF3815 family)